VDKIDRAERLLTLGCRLGEGPRWNAVEKMLYWVDIENHHFYRLDPATGRYERFDTGLPVGVLGFRQRGGLIMATSDGFAAWDFSTQTLDFIADPEADRTEPDARFNDGAVDRRGRFWAGTMTHTGANNSLYRLDPDMSVHTLERGLTITNGMGWSPDNRTMYLTDTNRRLIYAYAFDIESGTIANRRNFVEVPQEDGFPDGLAVDAEGFVWSAHWGGSRITRYDPEGKIERVVEVPVPQVTACAFGGPDLTDLYITTAWSGMTEAERAAHPMSGDLFALNVGIKGQAEEYFKG
jgi:sugar lactone lactonase YvrE